MFDDADIDLFEERLKTTQGELLKQDTVRLTVDYEREILVLDTPNGDHVEIPFETWREMNRVVLRSMERCPTGADA